MIGLDTNVLVRYLAQDDAAQAARATALIESFDEDDPGFVSLVVLAELHWVLTRAYLIGPAEVITIIRKLLDARELAIQEPDLVRRALGQAGHADFADAVISELGRAAGCSTTATFDKRAARLDRMSLVP